MAREFFRSDRVADAIQRSVATLIREEVRDPRVGMANINDVTVTRDLAYAKIYVTFVDKPDESECKEAVAVLNKAAAFIRAQLSKELSMRTTPNLQFFYDATAVRSQELSHLIDRAVASDKHPDEDS